MLLYALRYEHATQEILGLKEDLRRAGMAEEQARAQRSKVCIIYKLHPTHQSASSTVSDQRRRAAEIELATRQICVVLRRGILPRRRFSSWTCC